MDVEKLVRGLENNLKIYKTADKILAAGILFFALKTSQFLFNPDNNSNSPTFSIQERTLDLQEDQLITLVPEPFISDGQRVVMNPMFIQQSLANAITRGEYSEMGLDEDYYAEKESLKKYEYFIGLINGDEVDDEVMYNSPNETLDFILGNQVTIVSLKPEQYMRFSQNMRMRLDALGPGLQSLYGEKFSSLDVEYPQLRRQSLVRNYQTNYERFGMQSADEFTVALGQDENIVEVLRNMDQAEFDIFYEKYAGNELGQVGVLGGKYIRSEISQEEYDRGMDTLLTVKASIGWEDYDFYNSDYYLNTDLLANSSAIQRELYRREVIISLTERLDVTQETAQIALDTGMFIENYQIQKVGAFMAGGHFDRKTYNAIRLADSNPDPNISTYPVSTLAHEYAHFVWSLYHNREVVDSRGNKLSMDKAFFFDFVRIALSEGDSDLQQLAWNALFSRVPQQPGYNGLLLGYEGIPGHEYLKDTVLSEDPEMEIQQLEQIWEITQLHGRQLERDIPNELYASLIENLIDRDNFDELMDQYVDLMYEKDRNTGLDVDQQLALSISGFGLSAFPGIYVAHRLYNYKQNYSELLKAYKKREEIALQAGVGKDVLKGLKK